MGDQSLILTGGGFGDLFDWEQFLIEHGLMGFLGVPGAGAGTPDFITAGGLSLGDLAGFSNDIVSSITAEIDGALGTLTDSLNLTLNDLFGGIKDALGAIVGKIADIIGAGIGKIVDIIQAINLDGLKSVIAAIAGVLQKLDEFVTKLAEFLQGVLKPIVDLVTNITKVITDINDKLIQPIAKIVTTTMTTIGNLTTAIEKDLHEGLGGILSIPKDIADAMNTLDATMQRSIEQMGKINEQVTSKVSNQVAKDHIATPLGDLNKTSLTQFPTGTLDTTYTDRVALTEPKALTDVKGMLDSMRANWKDFPGWMQQLLNGAVDILVYLEFLLAWKEPIAEIAGDLARQGTPATKLDVQTVMEAWRRGFLDSGEVQDELSKFGYTKDRVRVFSDLERYLVDINQALDWWVRGIIAAGDLDSNLKEHGLSDTQITAFKESSINIFAPPVAEQLYLRNEIDENALRAVYTVNRIGEKEQDSRILLLLRKESPVERITAMQREIARGGGLLRESLGQPTPDVLYFLGKAAGEEPSVADDRWLNHWFIPSLDEWVTLFFRGVRTRTELYSAMDAFAVPAELKEDFIEARRPLVPFRSIPSMIAAGVIDEKTGRQYLEAHGFAPEVITALLKFAAVHAASSKAATAQKLHAASLTIAETLFRDGAITEDQFTEVLKEHGLSQDAIDMTVKYEQLKEQTDARKQVATDVVNEAVAGILTFEEAQQHLAEANFTVAEQARYLKSLRSLQRSNNKLPSEAELNHMMQKSIITHDDYTSTLQKLGFSKVWAERFLALRLGATTVTP